MSALGQISRVRHAFRKDTLITIINQNFVLQSGQTLLTLI